MGVIEIISAPAPSRHRETPRPQGRERRGGARVGAVAFRQKPAGADMQEEAAEQRQQQRQDVPRRARSAGSRPAPITGATASIASQRKAKARLPPFLVTTFTVLRPSAKSCASTAAATIKPMAWLAWKATPMAKPSSTLWAEKLAAPSMPRAGIGLAFAVMPRHQPVQHDIKKKAQRRDRQQGARLVKARARFQRLGRQIEEGDADHRAGGKAHHQRQPAGQLQRQQRRRSWWRQRRPARWQGSGRRSWEGL